jgi:photosystem II stability/assembly factor-like uncharacterized protein
MRRQLLIFILFITFTARADAQWVPLINLEPAPFSGSEGALCFKDGNLWCGRNHLYLSTDTGKTWVQMPLPVQATNIVDVDFFDKTHGAIVTNFDILATNDGGTTWYPLQNKSPLYYYVSLAVLDSSNDVLVSDGVNIYLTTDTSWQPVAPLRVSCLRNYYNRQTVFAEENDTSNNSHIYLSSDKGMTWNMTPGTLNDDDYTLTIDPCNNILYSVNENVVERKGPNCNIFRSTDTGRSWDTVFTYPLPYLAGSIVATSNVIYCQTLANGVLRSMDSGRTWATVGGPSAYWDSRLLTALDDSHVIGLDTNGTVWITNNGGDGKVKLEQNEFQVDAIPRVNGCGSSKAVGWVRLYVHCQKNATLESIALEGDTTHFVLDSLPTLPLSVGGGAFSDSFYVRFAPNLQTGSFTTTLHIVGTISSLDTTLHFDTTITITAIATPVPPQLAASAYTLDFGALSTCNGVGDTSIVFTNSGCAPDTITQITVTGMGFTGSNDTLPIIVQPGDSVTFNYRFVPPDSGTFTGEVRLNVSSMGLTENPAITLSGKGVQGFGILAVRSTALQAGSFSFCAGDTTLFDTIANTGCDTLVISNIVFTGDGTFTLLSPSNDTLLLPGDSAIIQFYFAPRTKGAHAAMLSFHSQNIVNDSGHTTTITLAGIGLNGTTQLFADTTARNFGALYACETRDTTITLYNKGCDTLFVDSGFASNGSYATNAMYPIILPPDSSATVRVLLTGDSAGMNGSLEFFSNANVGSKTAAIPLSASIIQPTQLHLSLSAPQSGENQAMVTFYLVLSGTGNVSAVDTIRFDLTHNDDLLSYVGASGAGLSVTGGAGTAPLHFILSPIPASDTIGSLMFQVYLTDSSETPLTLSNISFTNSLKLPNDCVASIDDASSGFTYNFQCSEQMIQDAMAGVPITISSIEPNPAGSTIVIKLSASTSAPIAYTLSDALGRSYAVPQSGNTLDVSSLPTGVYFVSDGVSRVKFVKE